MSKYQESTDKRTQQLNENIYIRNLPSTELKPNYTCTPVSTRYSVLPIIDRREICNEPLKTYSTYNTSDVFNPGNDGAPWSGFASNVNYESYLRNQFFALQKCDRAEFVPCTTSDLFSNNIPITEPAGEENLIFKEEAPIKFNPNPLNLGKETFNNFTRYQLKNLE